jgi:L-ascorbate metabolism protein UlaG (beta-lactamase superfamily)
MDLTAEIMCSNLNQCVRTRRQSFEVKDVEYASSCSRFGGKRHLRYGSFLSGAYMLRIFTSILCLCATTSYAERMQSHCLAFADNTPQVWRASTIPEDAVGISYIGHSMYLIETPRGFSAITDYAGGARGADDNWPELVTMNYAHGTHNTAFPNEAIQHVLRGVEANGKRAEHDLDLPEMLVRNVTTDIRSRYDGGRVPDANSIFIFEVAGMCIGHLGHLHHEPSNVQYAQMGRLDIVMAAVDGGMTLNTQTMIKVMKRVRASVVLPMHWRGNWSLDQFVDGMRDEFDVVRVTEPAVVFSLKTLPDRPTVMVMQPTQVPEYDDE